MQPTTLEFCSRAHVGAAIQSRNMLRSDYSDQNCSIARTLELVGERWTILIIREAFLGTRRFDEYQRILGVGRNVLQTRLERLLEADIMRRDPYQEHPTRT